MSDSAVKESCRTCKHRKGIKTAMHNGATNSDKVPTRCKDCIQPIVHKNYERDETVGEDDE